MPKLEEEKPMFHLEKVVDIHGCHLRNLDGMETYSRARRP